MSGQGVIALVAVGLSLVISVVVLVVVTRQAITAGQHPGPLTSTTWAQRRHASAQMRRGEDVAPHELALVRAIAAQANGQRYLALVPTATTLVFIALALLPIGFAAWPVLMAVLAAVPAATALVLLDHARRARRFLTTHPRDDAARTW